jgi:hypothetical protein
VIAELKVEGMLEAGEEAFMAEVIRVAREDARERREAGHLDARPLGDAALHILDGKP